MATDTKKYRLVFSHLEMDIPKKINKKVQKALEALDIKSYRAQILSDNRTSSIHIGSDDLKQLFDAMAYIVEVENES